MERRSALLRGKGTLRGVNKSNSRSNSSVLAPAIIARDPERSLAGFLIGSSLFKEKGLVKKTISITFQGVPHYLVSYYSIEDVDNKSLVTPSRSPFFQSVKPRTALIMSQKFRNAVDEITMYAQDENGFIALGAIEIAAAVFAICICNMHLPVLQLVVLQVIVKFLVAIGKPCLDYLGLSLSCHLSFHLSFTLIVSLRLSCLNVVSRTLA